MPDLVLLLIVILVIVLAVRGPAMLPKLGHALGRGVKEARDEVGSALHEDSGAQASAQVSASTAPGPQDGASGGEAPRA